MRRLLTTYWIIGAAFVAVLGALTAWLSAFEENVTFGIAALNLILIAGLAVLLTRRAFSSHSSDAYEGRYPVALAAAATVSSLILIVLIQRYDQQNSASSFSG
jgi:FtsH-binding integral membrane protein